MSFQGFIRIQCTRFDGKDLWRKLGGGHQERLFRLWDNCYAMWGGAIASLLFTLWTELTTEIIYSDPANSLPDPHPVDQWGSATVVLALDPYSGDQWDAFVRLGGAS